MKFRSYEAKNYYFLFQEELTRLKEIPNSLAVFCLATYGEGDPTDNAMDFFEWLHNGNADLTGLQYSVSNLSREEELRLWHHKILHLR